MKYCPNCGQKLNEGAKFCPECGLKIGKSKTKESIIKKSDNSKRILLFLLIVFWPAGLIYYFAKRRTIREIKENDWFLNHPFLTWLIFILVIDLILHASLQSNNQTIPITSNEQELTQSFQKEYLNEDLASILFKFTDQESALTELQKKELWNLNYKGKYIKFTAYVRSIDKKFGDYVVLADIFPRGPYDIGSDLAIVFKNSEKEKLLKIPKNSEISFEGKLSAYHSVMGNLDITDAILLE